MSDRRSQILPFLLVPIDVARPHSFLAKTVAVWPGQMSAQALLRQNAALRAQNTALKQALEREAHPLPRLLSTTKDPSTDIFFLPPASTIPDPAAQVCQCLAQRQRQVLGRVLAGHPSKNIAADLGISQRTVENHQAAIMRRTGATSIPALARIVIGAAQGGDCKAARGRLVRCTTSAP